MRSFLMTGLLHVVNIELHPRHPSRIGRFVFILSTAASGMAGEPTPSGGDCPSRRWCVHCDQWRLQRAALVGLTKAGQGVKFAGLPANNETGDSLWVGFGGHN